MVEKAVVNASILTATLAFVGFSILTLAHHSVNTGVQVEFLFLERWARHCTFSPMVYRKFALQFVATTSELFRHLDDKFFLEAERSFVESRPADESKKLSPSFHMVLFLILFVCGLLFSPTQRYVAKGMEKHGKGKNEQRSKWSRKNKKKIGKTRKGVKTKKRGKKRSYN